MNLIRTTFYTYWFYKIKEVARQVLIFVKNQLKDAMLCPFYYFFTSDGATLKNRNNDTEKVEQRKEGYCQLIL